MHIVSVRKKRSNSNHPKPKTSRPAVLYHASPINNLKIIKPNAKTIRDNSEGPVIFTTPDYVYAIQFLVPTDDSWAFGGLYRGVHYMICGNKKRFQKLDKGGTIYFLPTKSFHCDLKKSGREKEWVSNIPVKPIDSIRYESALLAMLAHGVQVYFTNASQYKKIWKNLGKGLNLPKNIKSENQLLKICTRSFK